MKAAYARMLTFALHPIGINTCDLKIMLEIDKLHIDVILL